MLRSFARNDNIDESAYTLASRAFVQNEHLEESSAYIKFKGLVSGRLYRSDDLNSWCLRYGVEIIPEMDEIAPIEAFVVGYRTWERILGKKGEGREHVLDVIAGAGLELDDKIVDFLVRLGDRVPVSESEDLVFLFPRDLYDKILVFNMVPD